MPLFTKSRLIVGAIALVLVGGGTAAYLNKDKLMNFKGMAGAEPGKKPEQTEYRLADVDKGSINQYITASGRLEPVSAVNIGTQVSGTVAERFVDFNDRVKAGQVLLKIDPTILQARIRQSEAQLASTKAQLDLAKANLARNQQLVSKGFISAAALDQLQQAVASATASSDVARAQLSQAQADLNNSIIKSPIDGVIIKRNIDVGQTVAASFNTPDLFQVARDLKQMQIITSVSEADVGMLKDGQPVKFVVDAYPDREFNGKVKQFRLNPVIQQGVVTYSIVIEVDNSEELLKPGMTAQTRILVANRENIVRIPTSALRYKPSDIELVMHTLKGGKKKDKDSEKAEAEKKKAEDEAKAKLAAAEEDDFKLTKDTRRVYKVYRLDDKNIPQPFDVTIGVANSRFTEMVTGEIKPGDKLVVRWLQGEKK
jgi:HlyD family secretion protein